MDTSRRPDIVSAHDHARDEERRIRELALDRTIADSFPASDPPSTIPNPEDHEALSAAVLVPLVQSNDSERLP
jgi:hypothetical protein